MKRRFLALLACSLALAAPTPAAQPAAGPACPNILWLAAEDLGPHLGCNGTPEVWTPNLDQLAAEGMRFTRAFTTAPVCSASRSAFMTGMYQTSIGAHNHRSHRNDNHLLPEGVRVLPDWLRDAGYYTANIVNLPPAVGFSGSGKTDWNFARRKSAFDSNTWSDLVSRQPFYAQINFSETHRLSGELVRTGRAFAGPKRADRQKVVLPAYYPDDPAIREDWANYLDDVTELDRKIGAVLAQLERDGLADNTIIIFFADHGHAHVRGKQWCYDSGLHVPLIVRWPKAFVAPAGFSAGSVNGQLIEAIDLAATTLAFAGAAKPARMQGRVLFGPHAEPPRQYAFGARDRCDETVFRIRTARDERYRFIRNFTADRPFFLLNRYKECTYPMIPVMRRLHEQGKLNAVQEALFAPHLPPEELYDLEADPDETTNLATSADPGLRAVRDRLNAALEQWIVESDDQGRFFESPEVVEAEDRQMEAYHRRVFGRIFRSEAPILSNASVDTAFGLLPQGQLLEVNSVGNPPLDHVIAIIGPRLIDGRGGPPVEDAVVIVRESRIEAAGPRGTIAVPAGAKRLDASGLTLLPGLIDLHLHASQNPEIPAIFLRNGVTAARDPGLWIEHYAAAIRSGRKIPRLFLTGPHFDQEPPAYPENALIIHDATEARAAVHRFVNQGATAIKVYFRLAPELIRATCEAAHARGIPVTGHLELVDAYAAIDAGLDGLEHVTSVGAAIAEPAVAQAFRAAVNSDNNARHPWRYKLWASLDLESPRVRRMAQTIARRGVVMSPTLTYYFARGPASRNPTDEHRRGFANMLGFVHMCHEAGASVVVGSHTMLNVEPGGKAFQKEMELMVEAGMSPMAVIVAATMEGARFLRAEKRIGSVEPGKLADLVLINGDPLKDIRATRNISRVMLNGMWVDDPAVK